MSEFRVSLVLIAYNQEFFIREACESVLNQMGESIEIVLSDDCSSDQTYTIMQQCVSEYTGPHKVVLNKTAKNMGLIEHINQVVSLSSGEIIVYAAGDDVSKLDRVQKTIRAFDDQNNDAPLIVHSSVQEIDEQSHLLQLCKPPIYGRVYTPLKMAQKYSLIIGASCAWNRSIWRLFGDIQYACAYEDAIMALRACMMREGALCYIDEPLVDYRVGGVSQGGRNKPKTRVERQKFELKRLQTRGDICAQRLDDAVMLRRKDIIQVLEHEKKRIEMMRLVYEKNNGWWQLIRYAIQNQCFVDFALSAIKRLRVM